MGRERLSVSLEPSRHEGVAGAAREDRTLDLSLTKGVLYH
jgi:hypothetical protein